MLFFTLSPFAHTHAMPGDLAPRGNPDGVVDIADAVVALSISVGKITPTDTEKIAGDVAPLAVPDGVVDIADAVVLLRVSVGLVTLPVAKQKPTITITTPANLSVVIDEPVTVTGIVDDPDARVVVNGVLASVSGKSFTASGVPLREGNNVLTAVATDYVNQVSTASAQIVLDTEPPRIAIDSPSDQFVTAVDKITVTGMVDDVGVGTVNAQQATVTVNGIKAMVANRAFIAADVLLVPGANTITATGNDPVNHTARKTITVYYQPPVAGTPQLRLVSGDNQTGVIGAELPAPLVVHLSDGNGNPVADKTVIFKIVENNGILNVGADLRVRPPEPAEVRSIAVQTDAQGQAQAHWKLGTRAGAGNHRVEATAVGFDGVALFGATALTSLPDKINVDAGSNQVGVAGQPLPKAFVAVVTDAGHNRLEGVPVTWTVPEDSAGNFNETSTLTVNTDSDGRAVAVLTLGLQEGIENHKVSATFSGNAGLPAFFVASSRMAGEAAHTRISGVVLDNSNLPIEGVTLKIERTPLETKSDAQGQFIINEAPVGTVKLIVDGRTAKRPGVWPTLEFEMITIAGQENKLESGPIYLLPIDIPNALFVDATHGGEVILPEYPGFKLEIVPGSALFPDGSRSGYVSVTVVHSDKIPMAPQFGQQPRFIVTIQPAGVIFDPPAPITLPNVDGLAPGQITEMYSFDHDLGSFVAIGTGTVSEDGLLIHSDPGVGIVKGGWHCGGNPQPTGSAGTCPECRKCVEDECVPDPAQNGHRCTIPSRPSASAECHDGLCCPTPNPGDRTPPTTFCHTQRESCECRAGDDTYTRGACAIQYEYCCLRLSDLAGSSRC